MAGPAGVRVRMLAILAGAAFVSAAGNALAAAQPPIEESVVRVPVVSGDGRTDAIDVTLFRAPGAERSPVVVLSHGSPRSAADRRRSGRMRFEVESRTFVAMGYAVAVPTRRGYGDSGGAWSEGYGGCADPDYYRAGLESARDIRAAVEALRSIPGFNADRVILVGQSAGGWGSVAASTLAIDGLAGVVNFAGGRGSYADRSVCREERLVEAAARYGKAARVPQLWIYSANDQYFGPDLARRMHAAFVEGGGRAQLLQAPATGADGHAFFGSVSEWAAPVQAFLRQVVEDTNTAGAARAGKGS